LREAYFQNCSFGLTNSFSSERALPLVAFRLIVFFPRKAVERSLWKNSKHPDEGKLSSSHLPWAVKLSAADNGVDKTVQPCYS